MPEPSFPSLLDRAEAAALFLFDLLILIAAGAGLFVPVLPEPQPWWMILLLVAAMDLPVILLATRRLLQTAAAGGFEHASAAVLPAAIVPQSWAVAVVLFGIISPLLGAPPPARWGMLLAGVLLHGIVWSIMKPRLIEILGAALARNEAGR